MNVIGDVSEIEHFAMLEVVGLAIWDMNILSTNYNV